jgi:hypothetical protein
MVRGRETWGKRESERTRERRESEREAKTEWPREIKMLTLTIKMCTITSKCKQSCKSVFVIF